YDGSLSDAGFAHEHWRIGALTMAENLYHLLNLHLAPNGRRNLVRTRQTIQRDAKMFQIRRQVEFFLVLLLFLFAYVNTRANIFDDRLGRSAEAAQHLDEHATLILRKR